MNIVRPLVNFTGSAARPLSKHFSDAVVESVLAKVAGEVIKKIMGNTAAGFIGLSAGQILGKAMANPVTEMLYEALGMAVCLTLYQKMAPGVARRLMPVAACFALAMASPLTAPPSTPVMSPYAGAPASSSASANLPVDRKPRLV